MLNIGRRAEARKQTTLIMTITIDKRYRSIRTSSQLTPPSTRLRFNYILSTCVYSSLYTRLSAHILLIELLYSHILQSNIHLNTLKQHNRLCPSSAARSQHHHVSRQRLQYPPCNFSCLSPFDFALSLILSSCSLVFSNTPHRSSPAKEASESPLSPHNSPSPSLYQATPSASST